MPPLFGDWQCRLCVKSGIRNKGYTGFANKTNNRTGGIGFSSLPLF